MILNIFCDEPYWRHWTRAFSSIIINLMAIHFLANLQRSVGGYPVIWKRFL